MVRRVRAISDVEGQKLAKICRHPSDPIELRRAQVILSSAQGFSPPYISRLIGYSPDWVRTLIREFNLHGFKALKPNSDYVSLAKTAVFDPVSIYAGVASPVYDAAGNYMIPALNGEITPAEAAKKIRDDLQALTK